MPSGGKVSARLGDITGRGRNWGRRGADRGGQPGLFSGAANKWRQSGKQHDRGGGGQRSRGKTGPPEARSLSPTLPGAFATLTRGEGGGSVLGRSGR